MKKSYVSNMVNYKKSNLDSNKLFFRLFILTFLLTIGNAFAQNTVPAKDSVNVKKSVFAVNCGKVYASGYSGGRESLYELNGATMAPVFTAPQIIGGLAVSANGNAYYDNGTFFGSPLYSSDGVTQVDTGAIVNLYVGEAADAIGNVFYIDNGYHLRANLFGSTGGSTDLGALIFDPGDTIGPTLAYGDMTFDGNGRLYWYASVSGFGLTYLYVIDTTTLKTSNLGNIGPDGATGLAFDIFGKLITTSNAGATVISVDLSSPTLEGTIIGTASPSVFDLGSCVTPFFNPILTATKSVANISTATNPATIAQPGNVLEYTIRVRNTGNLISNNSLFSDAIPAQTTYVPNSTTINGILVPDVAGAMPFAIAGSINSPTQLPGIINVGSDAVITFRVTVNPAATGIVANTASVSYPTTNSGITTTQATNSNTVVVTIQSTNAVLNATKTVANVTSGENPATTANTGEILQYTIAVNNSGTGVSNNTLFTDAIPAQTTYVPNSTTLNGITVADVAGAMPFATAGLINSPSQLPGVIPVGATATIRFRVTVNASASGVVSNTASVNYSDTSGPVTTNSNTVIVAIPLTNPILNAIKAVANVTSGENPATTANTGEILQYTIAVNNSGTGVSNNTLFTDAIPAQTTYVPNSTTLNGITVADVAGAMPFATAGLINSPSQLPGVIPVGATATIRFRVTVNASASGVVSNTASVNYSDTSGPVTTNSNTVIVVIPLTNPILNATKAVANVTSGENPATTANTGEILQFTIAVNNSGTGVSNNTLFTDAIPAQTTYVPNSTTLNGITVADVAGAMPYATAGLINSPSQLPGVIPIGETATISFRVTVNASASGVVSNTASVNYSDTSGPVTTNSNTVVVAIIIEPSEIEIHNYMSPDSDGINEYFAIDGLENFTENTVEIYNRWGVLIYSVSKYNNVDKSFIGFSNQPLTIGKDQLVPAGTYFYVVKYKNLAGKNIEKVGYLFLSR